MYLMVLVLNKNECLEEILEKLYSVGVAGATVIDSSGMGKTLCENVPMFGGFRSLFNECRPSNKTIFSVIKDQNTIRKATDAIEEVIGNLDTAGTGILFTFPLHQVKGFASYV